jgi:hypothetical protein
MRSERNKEEGGRIIKALCVVWCAGGEITTTFKMREKSVVRSSSLFVQLTVSDEFMRSTVRNIFYFICTTTLITLGSLIFYFKTQIDKTFSLILPVTSDLIH